MRTFRFIGRTVIVASLALIACLPVLSTQAADGSLAVSTPSQEIKAITDTQFSIPNDAPVVRVAPGQSTWVNDIMEALRMYFKANYPKDDFAPYLKKLNLIRDGLGRGDRRTVKLEMGAFFTMLTNRSHGISEGAAEELTNFARMVMPVQEYGIFFPRSGPEDTGQRFPGTGEVSQ